MIAPLSTSAATSSEAGGFVDRVPRAPNGKADYPWAREGREGDGCGAGLVVRADAAAAGASTARRGRS